MPLTFASLNVTFTDILRLTATFSLGYGSHIILDMLTPRGVELLWPNPNRHVLFKDKLQVEAASKGGIPVATLGLVLLVLAFPLSQYGLMTAFRWMLATPEAAIQEYKSSTTRTFVEFDSIWTSTKTPIHATAEVLDVHNKRLIVAIDRPMSDVQRPTSKFLTGAPPKSTLTKGKDFLGDFKAERQGLSLSSPLSQHKVTVSASSDRSAPGSSDSPPTRNALRVLVTLSDELSADIATQIGSSLTNENPNQDSLSVGILLFKFGLFIKN